MIIKNEHLIIFESDDDKEYPIIDSPAVIYEVGDQITFNLSEKETVMKQVSDINFIVNQFGEQEIHVYLTNVIGKK